MSGKIRIYDLARELGVSSKEILGELGKITKAKLVPSNTIAKADEEKLRKIYSGKTIKTKKEKKSPEEKPAPAKAKPTEAKETPKSKAVSPPKPTEIKTKEKTEEKQRKAQTETFPQETLVATPAPVSEKPKITDRPAPVKPKIVDRPVPEKPKIADKPKTFEKPPAEKPVAEPPKLLHIPEAVTVKELAERMNIKSKDLMTALLKRKVFANLNQVIDAKIAKIVAEEFGFLAEEITYEDLAVEEQSVAFGTELKKRELWSRAPIVTVMGHVDHGKTKLLDVIRKANVALKEAGGITQHIGAYKVLTRNPQDQTEKEIVFLDTPGHEAFTRMRARGASVTDIVVLVVAADDGVKPQTEEAISHARSAGVTIVVAINKMDKPGADPKRVRSQLAERGLMPEEWGGDTVMVEVSALKQTGITELLEMIALVADMKELKANPSLPARGAVLEAHIDRGHGHVATVLIKDGTLRIGDAFIAGTSYGHVRAILDDAGEFIQEAPPSTPVEILGLNGLPEAGDRFQVVEDEKEARRIATIRAEKEEKKRLAALEEVPSRLSLDTLSTEIQKGTIEELPIVLKCDVQGSLEVLSERLKLLGTEKVKIRILHRGLGAITEGDVLLAEATNAVILGFHVRPEAKARDLAERQKVDIRTFDIIYEITEAVEDAMLGMLKPTRKEISLGRAEVRQIFKISGVGTIAGCYVLNGVINRNSEVRLLRNNIVVCEGKISSLKRFKDDANEVKSGFECGIGIQNYNDIKQGDIIEAFTEELIKPTL